MVSLPTPPWIDIEAENVASSGVTVTASLCPVTVANTVGATVSPERATCRVWCETLVDPAIIEKLYEATEPASTEPETTEPDAASINVDFDDC